MKELPQEEEIAELRAELWPGDDPRLAWCAEFLEGLARALPDNAAVSGVLGACYTDLCRYEEALAVDRRTVALDPSDAVAWYNLGCSLALLGRREDAFAALERSVELGFADPETMEGDADLESLRETPRFARLMRAARKMAAARQSPEAEL